MKTLNGLIVLMASAIVGAGCGTLEDGRLCQDQDGVLVCEGGSGSLGSDEQALINTGGFSSGLGYICEDTDEGRTCTCMGQLDCLRMVENECIDDPDDLDCPDGGSTITCTCTGKPTSDTDGIGTSPINRGGFATEQQAR